jgi:hypothetical protein
MLCMYALLLFPRLSIRQDMGTQSCLRSLHTPFPRARFRVRRSAWLLKDISETGLVGELVCTRPHSSLPVRFWGDDARGSKFLKAYGDTYPGVWRHGNLDPRMKGYISSAAGSCPSSLLACADMLTLVYTSDGQVEPLGCTLWFGRDLRCARAPLAFCTHRRCAMHWPAPAAGKRRMCAPVHQDARRARSGPAVRGGYPRCH